MGPNLKARGVIDGREIELPEGLTSLVITTAKGEVIIDLTEQVENMVLIRAVSPALGDGQARLIASPMQSGRLAVGVIVA